MVERRGRVALMEAGNSGVLAPVSDDLWRIRDRLAQLGVGGDYRWTEIDLVRVAVKAALCAPVGDLARGAVWAYGHDCEVT